MLSMMIYIGFFPNCSLPSHAIKSKADHINHTSGRMGEQSKQTFSDSLEEAFHPLGTSALWSHNKIGLLANVEAVWLVGVV